MRSPRALSVLTLAAALAVSSCSSGSDGDATPTTSTTPATASTGGTSTTGGEDTTTTTGPTSTTEGSTTTSTPAAAPSLDELKSADIPAMCQHAATTLVDGADPSLDTDDGAFRLLDRLPDGGPSHLVGVPSDAGPLTVVVAECNAGGVGWPNPILFFGPGGTFYGGTFLTGPTIDDAGTPSAPWEQAWADAEAAAPGRDGVSAIALEGKTVVVTTSAELPDDSSCCPTGQVTVRIAPVGGQIEVVELTRTDAD